MARSTPKTKRPTWIEPLLLGLFTAALWARSLAVPIHEWDDSVYLFRDSRLDHLTWENLGRILTQPFFANFHPITTLTYAFDRAVWGAWTPGFHITQILFYVGGVLGLYFLFARLLNSRPAALAAAAIFAAHTIHVESVAWLASRKDVVCLFFYAPALYAYIRYAEDPSGRPRTYAISLFLGAAAMLSKGYAVILPAALLAYDYCFTGRITRRNLLDKVPFLLASASTVLLTLNAQGQGGALVNAAMDTGRRVALLAKVFALYAGKTLLPIDLSAFYTIAAEPTGSSPLFGFAIAAAMAAGLFLLRRKAPAAAFGIALYVLPLATVMNVFFRLQIWMADRYLFLPTVGSSLALVAMVAHVARRRSEPARSRGGRSPRVALSALAVLVVAVYSGLTFARIDLWTSRVRLWSDVVRKELHLGGSGPVRADDLARVTNIRNAATTPIMSLARAYGTGGDGDEAERISALLNAGSGGAGAEGPMTLAQQDLREGRPEDAIRRLQPIAASGTWLSPLATMWMGVAQGRMGQRDVGRQTILQGVELYRKTGQPATDGLLSVGSMAFNREEYAEAETWYHLATEQSPREANPKFYLARALEAQGKLPEALALYKRIASGEVPIMAGSMFTLEDVYLQMGGVEQKLGNPKGAIACGEKVLQRSPNHPQKEEIRTWIAFLRTQAK